MKNYLILGFIISFISKIECKCNKIDWENEIIDLHNRYREKHCTPIIKWNCNISKIAKTHSEELCKIKLLQISNNKKYGENLYMSISPKNVKIKLNEEITKCVDTWYNGINYYNYGNPSYSQQSGTFTQLVWKNTTQIGCGIANCEDTNNKYLIVTCNYKAPGNFYGMFIENVAPLC